MVQISGVIFDLGNVVVDWNPRRFYLGYFEGDAEKADWFLENICTDAWNDLADAGIPISEVTDQKVAKFPEWEAPIRAYFGNWLKMVGPEIPGSYEVVRDLKDAGYHVYALSNWSAETFPLVRDVYPVFSLFEKRFISGERKMIKPDPRFFQLAIDEIGLPPDQLVFTDDKQKNVDGATAKGIRGIVFQNAAQLRADLQNLDVKI